MVVSGLLSIGIGALLLATQGTASLGGLLSIDAQYEAESWIVRLSSQASNLGFGVAALAILLAVGGVYWWRSRRAEAAAAPSRSAEPPSAGSPTAGSQELSEEHP